MAPPGRPAPSADPELRSDGPLVELGPIVNRHGIRGEVRMLPHNPDSTTAATAARVVLLGPGGQREVLTVRSARRHKRFILLHFVGIESADAAEALVGRVVAVPRAALPAAAPGSVYHADLLGCVVWTTRGERLGTVREMMVTGSNDVCVVRDGRREVLVPLVADVISELDVSGGRLVVRPLPGLLDDDR
jgi:16S rRNA processing protein RimM